MKLTCIPLMLLCAALTLADAPATQPAGVTLTVAWTGEALTIPAATAIPDGMQQTREYQDWQRRGDARKLTWTAPDGRRYDVETMGFVKDNGQRKPVIPMIRVSRADGTVEQETRGAPDGPNTWTTYAADGKTVQTKVTNRLNGLPGTPFIQYVTVHDPDGQIRQYYVNRHGVIWQEWQCDANGNPAKPLQGGKQLEDATPETIKK